ncbi:MAG: tetratricopeptide repeat protein [Candidatus Omnitrophota bacterium]
MKRKIIFLLICFMAIALFSYAEIVVLKKGKIIEGKILERTDKYIKIDMWDIPITYYLTDVDSIDGQKIVEPQGEQVKPDKENKIFVKEGIPSTPLEEKETFVEEKTLFLPIALKEKLSLGELKEAQEYLRKATNLLKERKYKESAFEFENALKINPELAEGYYGLGYVYVSTKSYPEAVFYFKKAIEVSPNYAEAYNGLAYVSSISGNYIEAIKYYQNALKIKKDDLEAYNGLGFSYASLGKNKEAIDCFKAAIKINPEYASAYSGLGALYLALGQDLDAKENFLKAKAIFEKNKDTEGVKAIEEYLKKLP